MLLEMEETKRATTNEELDELESRLKIVLPADYRNWLLKYNGGRPDPARFRYKNETGPYTDGTVAWFLAVYEGEYSNFEFTFRKFKVRQRRLPENLVAIVGALFQGQFGWKVQRPASAITDGIKI